MSIFSFIPFLVKMLLDTEADTLKHGVITKLLEKLKVKLKRCRTRSTIWLKHEHLYSHLSHVIQLALSHSLMLLNCSHIWLAEHGAHPSVLHVSAFALVLDLAPHFFSFTFNLSKFFRDYTWLQYVSLSIQQHLHQEGNETKKIFFSNFYGCIISTTQNIE